MHWEVLKSPSKIWNFLGFARYYRRFTKDFSKITVLVTHMTRRGMDIQWGPEQQSTFQILWRRLCEATILTLPDGVEDFMIFYDASITSLGAVFM